MRTRLANRRRVVVLAGLFVLAIVALPALTASSPAQGSQLASAPIPAAVGPSQLDSLLYLPLVVQAGQSGQGPAPAAAKSIEVTVSLYNAPTGDQRVPYESILKYFA